MHAFEGLLVLPGTLGDRVTTLKAYMLGFRDYVMTPMEIPTM